jgi:hypothetical protein
MPSPFADFRAAVEKMDAAAAVELFSDDCVFVSPVVHKPYRGRAALHAILSAVMQVFEEFRYVDEYGAGSGGEGTDGHVLRFACRVGDRELEGVDILTGDGEQLTELTVMVRPYSAATLLRERMAALLS